MNKIIVTVSPVLATVVGICMLPATAFAVQGDPIPGVDVSVEQSPVGIVIQSAGTDYKGTFTFRNLAQGQYAIRLHTPTDRATGVSYSSAKISSSSQSSGATTQVSLSISLFTTGEANASQPILVTIGAGGGTISGTVMSVTGPAPSVTNSTSGTVTSTNGGGSSPEPAEAGHDYNSAKSNTAGITSSSSGTSTPMGVSQNYNSSKSNTAGITAPPVTPRPAAAGHDYNSAKSNTAGIQTNATATAQVHATSTGFGARIQSGFRGFFRGIRNFFSF